MLSCRRFCRTRYVGGIAFSFSMDGLPHWLPCCPLNDILLCGSEDGRRGGLASRGFLPASGLHARQVQVSDGKFLTDVWHIPVMHR